MRATRSLTGSLLLVVSMQACDGKSPLFDRMGGCYSDRQNGAAAIEILHQSNAVYAAIHSNGVWDTTTMRSATPRELAQLLVTDTSGIADALLESRTPHRRRIPHPIAMYCGVDCVR